MVILFLPLILLLQTGSALSEASLTCSFHAQHSCDFHATCEDLPDGSFKCVCPENAIGGDGLKGENNTGCIFEGEKTSCLANSTCVINLGFCSEAHFCECIEGFKGNGVTECLDINECNSDNQCDINANCINMPGSYNCSCKEDYVGNGFICNKTCIDDLSCSNNSFCNFTRQQCQCRPGYKQDGELCIDINECEELLHNCHAEANCTNFEGSYNCTCLPGRYGNGINCTSTPFDCQDVLNRDSSQESGYYLIDPDTVGPIEAFQVYCIMRGDLGITVIETIFYQQVSVGMFNVTYDFEINVIKKIIEISKFCYQSMTYSCYPQHTMFDGGFFWTDGNGDRQYNWGGSTEENKCLCGTINYCEDQSKSCNCHNNDKSQTDTGMIIDKSRLPILSYNNANQKSSSAKITFGNLQCSSKQFDIPKDCHEMKFKDNKKDNITTYIDIDGEPGPLPPTVAFCDMTSEEHVGITIVPHDWIVFREVTTVNFSITYEMKQEVVKSLINSSLYCMQEMNYICKNSPLMINNKTMWYDGNDIAHNYWPGAMGVNGMCGCGVLKSCDNAEAKCNCDILDGKEREDFGVIIDKSKLPISRILLDQVKVDGKGVYRLGPLKCSQIQFGIKESCQVYRHTGSEKSYTYLIDVDGPTGDLKPFPVYCKMAILPPFGTTIVHHHIINITSTIEFTYLYTSLIQIEKLISASAYCSQSYTYHCTQAPLTSGNKFFGPNNLLLTDTKCDCVTEKNCYEDQLCNCDANATSARSDSVTITASSYLPITKIEMDKLLAGSSAQFDVGPLICLNILRSCNDIMAKYSIQASNPYSKQHYTIDPDGHGNIKPFMVYCNWIFTELKNDVTLEREDNTTCFSVKYKNSVTPEQVMALVKSSETCAQYVNYQCYRNPGTDHVYYETCDGRTYEDMTGLSSESMCSCGLRGSCIGGASHNCNCDSETQQWLSDKTYIHNKSRLAICKVCAKMKSYNNSNIYQKVNINVFTLYCSKHPLSYEKTCQVHRNRRKDASSEYFLLSESTGIQVPVYCEMIYNPPTGILIIYPRNPIIEITEVGIDIEVLYFIIDMTLVTEIIKRSVYCTQELTIFCNSSALVLNDEYGWYSRDGIHQNYWPGNEGGAGCTGGQCNCRIENGENQSDSGTILNKNLLPVSKIKLGPSKGNRNVLIGPVKCYNVYKDCQEIKENYMHKNPLRNNVYPIDPDGAGGEHLFAATCNFTNRYVAVTEVTHSLIDFTTVTFSSGKNITLNYTLSTVNQINALVNYSNFCHQDVEYECKKTPLINNGSNPFGYLVSYNGKQMDRFGVGNFDNVIGCACMITGTCPAEKSCECDTKSVGLKRDQGVVTKKSYLPISQAIFQPTTTADQEAKIYISSIKCSSKPIYLPINCVDAYTRGMKTGPIFIQPADTVSPFFVYCDMEMISTTGVTIIRNELEITTTITGRETHVIYFNVTYAQIEALIMSHNFCYQPVKYNCRYTKFMGNGNANWNGKGNSKKTYFGNTKSKTNMCTCGAENRCGGPGNRNTVLSRMCNCDSYDSMWRADAGVFSVKDDLPLRFLSVEQSAKAESKLTVGKLYCADEEIDLNECNLGFHDCHINATCVNTKEGFQCYCKKGYQARGTGGVATGRECPDDDECRLFMCPWSARCYNLPGTFKCVCYSGFRQTGPTTCEDIDECTEGTHDCDKNAKCWNTIGSYFCRCNRNFIGDGKTGDCRKIGICQLFGDPHSISFDEKWLHFQGLCKYTLLRDNCFKSGQDANFRVEALFWNKDIIDQVNTWVKEITIFLGDLRIDLLQGKEVRVNGVTTRTPYRVSHKVLIRPGHNALEVFTDIGLRVTWNGISFVKIILEDKYVNSTCGICGDFNGIKEDDWKMGKGCAKDGELTTNPSAFGQSWVTEDNSVETNSNKCSLDCDKPANTSSCSEKSLQLAEYRCGKLHKDFEECLELMEPAISQQFLFSCKYDLCFTPNLVTETLCQYMEALMTECQENMKVKIIKWQHFCRQKCGPNQKWKSCGKLTDVKTCFELAENQLNQSKEQCSKGCFCQEGYVRQENECIQPSECGCSYNNTYYAIGDPIVLNACAEKAFCEPNNTITFSDYTCGNNAACKIKDGVFDCFCNDGFFGNGTQCYEDHCKTDKNNCSSPSECISVEGGHYCQCPDGFNTNCDYCEDIDECQTNTNDCDKIGECKNEIGSYKCSCPEGYYVDEDKCEDLDECDMKLDNCPNNSRCFNTPGSFICKCCSGYNLQNGECVATGSITPEEQSTCCACHGYLCGIKGEICGTDAVSYSNWTELIISACEKKTKINLDYRHKCKKSCDQVHCPKYQMCVVDEETGNPKCICEPCTDIEIIKKPVCSQVHVIYDSFCDFKKFQCIYNIEQIILDPAHCKAVGEGAVGEWSVWSDCSVTCGQGSKNRTREPLRILNIYEEANLPLNSSARCYQDPCNGTLCFDFKCPGKAQICSVTDEKAECSCPNCTGDGKDPVCARLYIGEYAYSEETFNNPCEAHASACENNQDFVIVKDMECHVLPVNCTYISNFVNVTNDGCQSEKQINVGKCSGGCGLNTGHCCNAVAVEETKVKLICPDGNTKIHSVTTAQTCECIQQKFSQVSE